ncbi:MAG: isoprenyl transferase [Verrucomicrobiota bacterium]
MSDSSEKASTPRHVAVIMDGNGRWAKERGLSRSDGHRAGAESVRECVEACEEIGIKYLTLYSFSSENWKRPPSEIKSLMSLLERFLKEKTPELNQRGVRLQAIGRINQLPKKALTQLHESIQATAENTGLTLVLALNYGAREEIVDGVKSILRAVEAGHIDSAMINTEMFGKHLYTRYYPDPDLLIRTSGELRLSNFLLWQISYAELIITRKFWPDFRKQDLHLAVEEYSKRQRRFGGV